jgi:hypothetical protein
MDKIRNLLHQVAIISKKNAEILDATGGRFNVFSVCGVNHYENTHSAIIAELLNPNGSHGLKEKLLEAFIETLGDQFTLRDFEPTSASVHTEAGTTDGRMDILIKDRQNRAIIIENKVYANDQWEQLKRYDKFARDNYRQYQILYLTLSGHEADEQSGGGVVYEQISYHDTLIKWLERCVTIAARYPGVRETLIQYINHLKQLTNQDMSTKNEQEIAEVLAASVENLQAAKSISQNFDATFDILAENHFNWRMKIFAEKHGLEYIYRNSGEEYIHFELKKSTWPNYWIAFTWEKSCGPYFGITNYGMAQIPIEKIEQLREQMMKSEGGQFKSNNSWAIQKMIPNSTLDIDVWFSDIIKSTKYFDDCCAKIERLLTAMQKTGLD